MSKSPFSHSQVPPAVPSAGTAGSYAPGTGVWLTTIEAAKYLKVSKSFLDKLRVYGGGPLFVRLGPRKILYRQGDLDAWMAARVFNSTSQYGVASR
jgi:excisionase family DNA binding protein